MKFSLKKPLIFLCFAAVLGCTQAKPTPPPSQTQEAWDSHNNPLSFHIGYQTQLSKLPITGMAQQKPWSDTYWPSFQGGIAARWQVNQDGFSYEPYAPQELQALTPEELMALSPAEKYDIFMGRYDYPTLMAERKRNKPDAKEWEGLCHGWAPASVLYKEPSPKVLVNPDGIAVPFGSSDIKSLLTHYLGVIIFEQKRSQLYRYLGLACYENLSSPPGTNTPQSTATANSPRCRDLNAGAFHVTLANQIGLLKQSFIVDIKRDAEIWNQPVMSYYTEVLGPGVRSPHAAPRTQKIVRVLTKMRYAAEVGPHWQPLMLNNTSRSVVTQYVYDLELDGAGRIVGGEWVSWERPDFLWTHAPVAFEGYWTAIGDLID